MFDLFYSYPSSLYATCISLRFIFLKSLICLLHSYFITREMVILRNPKWLYAAAGSGVVLGIFNYLQSEKKCAETSWTTNFEPSVKWDYNWDKREPSFMVKPVKKENDPLEQNRINEEKIKQTPTARRYLFLIRHGQYDEDAKTDPGRRLTVLGKQQAELVGKRLKDLKFNYSKLIHSTMTRAIETANIVHKYLPDLPVESSDLLREGSPIPPEPPLGSWREGHMFFEDGARIEAAFRKYFHRADAKQKSDSYEIMVCHANVIRYFVCRALQFPPEAWLRFSLHHCSITWICILPTGRVAVIAVGESGFLPPDKMTTK